MKIAIFPGTFDPFTSGHEDLVLRGLTIFDKIIIAFGENTKKQTLFELETRMNWVRELFENYTQVEVDSYTGLTVDFAVKNKAHFILRGLRTVQDFSYEEQIANVNADISDGVETIFLIAHRNHSSISSTIVRELIKYNGPYKKFLPKTIFEHIHQLSK
jgi:pantetheine-phosphate adenylyltransferase